MMHISTHAFPIALLSALLGGCAETHRGVEAVGRVGFSPASAAEATAEPVARPDVKTVRPRGSPRAPNSDTAAVERAGASTVIASAVPTPQQIFDFHPAGSAPGSFRQPFIIDLNDGPLTADVQRSAKELRDYNDGRKTGTAIAGNKRCSEMDVAHDKQGCVGVKPQATSSVSRDPPARQ